MAGLWDIVTVTGDENQQRVNISLLRDMLTGLQFGVYTGSEARATLETSLGRSFSTDEWNDLLAINTQLGGQADKTDKLVYLHKLTLMLNSAELTLVDEAEFRSVLGIT